MKTTIILLRGVMPTGKNKVLMAPLRTALEEVGLSQVRTYIQSGNVIVSTRLGLPAVERLVHETIKEQLGAELKVLARHVPYFEEVLARNPFKDEDPAKLYFTLLASLPEAATLAAFQALDHAPDQVRVVGDMAYVRCHTVQRREGQQQFHREKLKLAATTRNFNTISKLVALGNEG